jgi:hypothetical protein
MKQLLVGAICLCLLSKCNEQRIDSIKSFIPGTYIMPYANEYSKGNDTLIIKALNKYGSNYQVERNTAYQRIRSGKELTRESKHEQWVCIYDSKDKVLNETRTGKVISFLPEKKTLLIGSNEYKKIE